MYEVVIDLFPYPDLKNKKISDFDFQNQILTHNLRPKFDYDYPIKETLKSLIEQCWSEDPKCRPTFTKNFEKLCQKDYFFDETAFP